MRLVHMMIRCTGVAVLIGLGVAWLGTPEQATAQTSASVSIVDFSFSAGTVTGEAGGSVTWTNDGAAPHSATGDGGEFDTGVLNSGESATITFSTPGTYTYHCSVHPDMVATVVVTAVAGDDDDEPVIDLPNTGSGLAGSGSAGTMGLLAISGAVTLLGSLVLRMASR